jgi:prepilin-type N-terminal cleavage/methylation domain-containing protein
MQLRTRTRANRAGMTLIEILTVAAIIGLLAAIAMPFFIKARHSSQNSAFASDLRVAVSAFVTYSVANKAYPAESNPGVLPAGLNEFLTRRFRWANETPIGGYWDWDYNQHGIVAGVSVFEPERTPAEMRKIDQLIDDGDLGTGMFRARARGYIYIVED